MANPNIVSITSMVGVTTMLNLTTTNETVLVSNAASSGIVKKINSIVVSNVDGTNTANITVKVHDTAAGGGSGYALASTIDVVADSSLVVLDKATPIYLEEDRSIVCTASAANDLHVVCSLEEIS